ncbi:hypothetical protein BJP34_35160 [Moorena producens PAL-8-15-08-1]|uniref:Uncharacterized protein n=2 Tax=Moorena TaxID=1155738 RepID=A0A1D8U295_9CYAN|nr:hypothetical protein BJP34_35160 [Moorena producens PAL-8-15-08-1]
MHRSGTSCLAGSLQAAGLYGGTVDRCNADNLKGCRENLKIIALNDAVLAETSGTWKNPPDTISWTEEHQQQRDAIIADFYYYVSVWMFKDPRTLLTLPFWREGIPNLHFIGTFRHPMRVAMSLYHRSGFPLRDSLTLWIHYNRIILDSFRQSPFPLLCFDLPQQEYLSQLEQGINHLCSQVKASISLSIPAAQRFYETRLVNQNDMVSLPPQNSNRDHDHSNDSELLATAAELYRNLRQAAGLTLEEAEEAVVQTSGYTVPLEESITACQEVIKSQPDNPHAYFMLGNAQRQQEDIDGAIASYGKAIELAPDNYYFYRHLSTLLYQQERLDEAITVCQQALQSQPENPLIYMTLGQIQLQKGNQAEGMANCEKARLINKKGWLAAKKLLSSLTNDSGYQLGEVQNRRF